MNGRSLARRVAALVAGMAVLAACGIGTDEGPRDIPPGEQQELGTNTDRNVGVPGGAARIYLLGPSASGQTPTLQPVARDVAENPTEVLEALLDGASATELARQFRTAIPTGTILHEAKLQSGVLRVDLSEELLQVSGGDLVVALAQIVFTASELDGVRAVRVLVDGAEQQWPGGSGELQSRPLTVYDYPGMVASAQPSYPAVPTPTQP